MKIFGAKPSDYAAPLVLIVCTALYIATAYTYRPAAAEFPLAVAWATMILLVLDFLSRAKTSFGTAINLWLNGGLPTTEKKDEDDVPLSRQFAAILWVAGLVAGMYVIGIMYSTPIYVFTSMYFFGRRSLLTSLIAAGAITIFVYLMFELFLGVELFPGVLFGGTI